MRESGPCSLVYGPALDIVLHAEVRTANGLESSQVGMNIVNVLDERGNAVNLPDLSHVFPNDHCFVTSGGGSGRSGLVLDTRIREGWLA
jgi:hypothetical protein